MIVHSKDFVTNLDEACIQPNAVDLRIEAAEQLIATIPSNVITISETAKKQFISRVPVPELDGTFNLQPGGCYDVVSEHSVTIPEGMVGWLIIRSTLARNGCIIGNGLYDSGYSGVIGCVIHNLSPSNIRIEKGARFAQFIMAKAETAHMYDGHYNQQGGFSK